MLIPFNSNFVMPEYSDDTLKRGNPANDGDCPECGGVVVNGRCQSLSHHEYQIDSE